MTEPVWHGAPEASTVSRDELVACLLQSRCDSRSDLAVSVACLVAGAGSAETIARIWQTMIEQHAELRARFTFVDGTFVRTVQSTAVSDGTTSDVPLDERATAPFDLAVTPSVRVTCTRVEPDRLLIAVEGHQAVCCRSSLRDLVREFVDRLSGAALPRCRRPALEPLARRALWTRAADRSPQHWFTGARYLVLPADRPRRSPDAPAEPTRAQRLELLVLADTDRVQLARTTTMARSLACLLFVLHRYTGETDITIGLTTDGESDPTRPAPYRSLVRCDLAGDPTFRQLIHRAARSLRIALRIDAIAPTDFVETLYCDAATVPTKGPAINVTFHRTERIDVTAGGIRVEEQPPALCTSLHELDFVFESGERNWLSGAYDADRYDRATVAEIVRRTATLIDASDTIDEQPLSGIDILTDDERHELVVESNATSVPYPAQNSIVELFRQRVAERPDAVAVVCTNGTLTYAELDAASDRLANELLARNVAPGQRVGVLMGRSTDLLVSLFAVLKSGNAFIPLDPEYPRARLEMILATSRPAAVITHANHRASVASHPAVLVLDGQWAAHALRSSPPDPAIRGDMLAYILYTSGSTGTPKGVAITHRNLLNVLAAVGTPDSLAMTPADVLVAVTTISFDMAILELFAPLVYGARLVVADEGTVADVRRLAALLRAVGATIMQGTPMLWQTLVDTGWNGMPGLTMISGGEALSRTLADALITRGRQLWNGYGPTETTIYSSLAAVEPESGPVSIGGPLANTQFYVAARDGSLLPAGVMGELLIGGDGVAAGYFDRPDLTAERFPVDPYRAVDGARLYRTGDLVRRRGRSRFEFLGRIDHQVKIHGFRVELGEIEASLLALPDIRQAIVVKRDDPQQGPSIWAFVVPAQVERPNSGAWAASVRARLSEFLPHYMVPAGVVALAALPQTPNGKVDRKALPFPPIAPHADGGSPHGPFEEALAKIVVDLLGCERLDRDADIFALGFHSRLAARLSARIQDRFDARIPPRAIYDAPTVRQLALTLAAVVEKRSTLAEAQAITVFNPEGTRRPFFYLHSDVLANGRYCRRLVAAMAADQPFVAIGPHGTAGLPLLRTVEEMARDYVPRIRAIQPAGPYALGGFCGSGLVAFEVARLLVEAGEPVELLIAINAAAPFASLGSRIDRTIRRIAATSSLNPYLRERLCYNIALLVDAVRTGPRASAELISQRLRSLLQSRELDEAPFERFDMHGGTPETENHLVHVAAALTYHPQRYAGEVTLVWSSNQRSGPADPAPSWRYAVDRTRVVYIGGSHVSPLHDRIDELGQILAKLLANDGVREVSR